VLTRRLAVVHQASEPLSLVGGQQGIAQALSGATAQFNALGQVNLFFGGQQGFLGHLTEIQPYRVIR